MDDPKITTIESALAWAHVLLKNLSEQPRQEARILLCEVMEVKSEYLLRYPEKALTFQQAEDFQQLVGKRSKGHPIAYLVGRQAFYDIEVVVSPDVLIPRPETELLVEKALAWGKDRPLAVVDVGVGSGVIALVMAKHLPLAQVTGIDVSEQALEIARYNSEELNLSDRIRWLQGDLLQPVLGEQFDLILANLPYIANVDMPNLEVAKHEPHLALDGGVEGLDLIRRFLQLAPQVLKPDGLLLMEIGASQGQAVKELAQAAFPQKNVRIEPDLAGHDRLISVE